MVCLFSLPTQASKLRWHIKREVGTTSVWKYRDNSELRASSQVINSSSVLNTLENKKEFIESLEAKKSSGMSFIGINEWQAKKYDWKKDSLEIEGTYIDSKSKIVYFREKHFFLKTKTIISLLTSYEKKNMNQSDVLSFFETSFSWESKE